MCPDVSIVKIKKPEKYGIMMERMNDTAIISFGSNLDGICVNIAHADYDIVPHNMWDTLRGEVIVFTPGVGHVNTGLMIWKE